jgi:hypothetical protein
MKKLSFLIISSMVMFFSACQPKVDIEKEKEAIKAVIEEEKNAYMSQDFTRMSETWAQESSSIKVYMNIKGYTKDEGWDAISKRDQGNVQDTSWDRKLAKFDFNNYQINVINNSAWVLFDAHFWGIRNEDTISVYQTRIDVLKKVDGKWKFTFMAMQSITPK